MAGGKAAVEAGAVRSVGNLSATSDGIFSEGFQTPAENPACARGAEDPWRLPAAARIDRGLIQKELAAVLGVVYQTVVKWENNVTQIRPHSRARILAFLGDPPSSPDANPTGDCRNI